MRLLNISWFLIFFASILALSQPADAASFYCNGWRECTSSSYPYGCCVAWGGNVVPVCISEDLQCGEVCCVGGGCDSYDDFRFCMDGFKAYCGDWGIRCCIDGYKYSETANSCIPESWSCYDNRDCSDTEICSNRQCVAVTCPSDYYACDGNLRQFHTYEIYDHSCHEKIVSSQECQSDEVCQNGNCIELQCPANEPFCLDTITYAEKHYTPINHQCVESTVNTAVCADNEICNQSQCMELDCDDGDNCTLDNVANHQCIHIFLDQDSDGVCDAQDSCPETFGSGADGCPSTVGEIVGSYEDYFWMIPIGIAGVIIVSMVIMILRRKPKKKDYIVYNR